MLLSGSLVEAFVPEGSPVAVGTDGTPQRRWGKKISAGCPYPETRRVPPTKPSSRVRLESSGLLLVCAMLSVEIAWASRVWALPFLSVLAPSESVMARPAGQAPREKITPSGPGRCRWC